MCDSSCICMHRYHARGVLDWNKPYSSEGGRVCSLFGVQGPFRLVHAQSLCLLPLVYYCTYTYSYIFWLYLYLSATIRLLALVYHCSAKFSARVELEVSPSRNQARLAPTAKSTIPKVLGLYPFDYTTIYASAGLAYLLVHHGGIGIRLHISWILSLDRE